MTLTYLLFSTAPLAFAPPLTFPSLPPLPTSLAPGRCYRTWVLIIFQFFYLSHFLRSFALTNVPILQFSESSLGWLCFLLHRPSAEEHSSIFLSSAASVFTSLALNAAKSSIPFGRIKRAPKAWWSAEVESAVSERCKAFAAPYKSDRQGYISAAGHASSVIAKAKAETWQATCFSLSPQSNSKSVLSSSFCRWFFFLLF